jgi:hypothetical protein
MNKKQTLIAALAVCCAATVALAAGCTAPREQRMTDSLKTLSPEQATEFGLVEKRCSQCHSVGKLWTMYSRDTEKDEWVDMVNDMSSRPGSRIRRTERAKLADMLYHWSQQAPKE